MHIPAQASTWTNLTNQLVEFNLRAAHKQLFTAAYEEAVVRDVQGVAGARFGPEGGRV